MTVSYTHLDVYKRQDTKSLEPRCFQRRAVLFRALRTKLFVERHSLRNDGVVQRLFLFSAEHIDSRDGQVSAYPIRRQCRRSKRVRGPLDKQRALFNSAVVCEIAPLRRDQVANQGIPAERAPVVICLLYTSRCV